MPKIPTLLELIKAGVHLGHQTSKWHPKMESYIYTVRDGIHIIDLEKTVEGLKGALEFIENIASKGEKILFLGTKPQAKKIIKKEAEKAGMPYLIEKWIGGTFTNFPVISGMIKNLKDLEEKEKSGELKKYPKKERIKFEKEIKRLERIVGGIKDLERLPKAIFIVDLKKEKTAVIEARKKKIPIIAICDTNSNPELVDWPIPANDDAIKSLEIIIGLVSQAILEGKEKLTKTAKK